MVAVMCLNVTSCQVGYRSQISIGLFFKYEKVLVRKWITTVLPAPEFHTEFKWHVQPVMLISLFGLATTEIMNRVSGCLEQFPYLINP